ncbi:hypothetical protein [Tautonia plasticadhaerens]|uniref:Uncharacterized protein n=1 Tax=Tautonia plasticadhaerens TaxID=2527974 RepID=A0A518GVT4_9BACT|nr:hypothetical protein [Tautonia plasticadhaerens]QDV32706.1 hypothetical protein ElP_05450 [Tautonia plasticadhaerens]
MTPDGPAQGPTTRALPMVLFGMLTLLTFAGPLAIFVVGRGGERPSWPPDRPIEWRVFLGVTTGFLALLVACVADGMLTLRRLKREGGDRASATAEGTEADS